MFKDILTDILSSSTGKINSTGSVVVSDTRSEAQIKAEQQEKYLTYGALGISLIVLLLIVYITTKKN